MNTQFPTDVADITQKGIHELLVLLWVKNTHASGSPNHVKKEKSDEANFPLSSASPPQPEKNSAWENNGF